MKREIFGTSKRSKPREQPTKDVKGRITGLLTMSSIFKNHKTTSQQENTTYVMKDGKIITCPEPSESFEDSVRRDIDEVYTLTEEIDEMNRRRRIVSEE
jgi:hypothetical protein